MTYTTKRLARMVKWCEDNPQHLYAAQGETLSDDMTIMLLKGDMDGFNEKLSDMEINESSYPEFWDYWMNQFAEEFGYDGWADMPDRIMQLADEHRWVDSGDWLKNVIRNTRPYVVAVLRKQNNEPVFGPSLQHWDREEWNRAKYIRNAFGFHATPSQVARQLEIIYGGYDNEYAIVIGTVDLWEIYQSGKAPTHVTVGSRDTDNLLWYDFFNGCGNMGTLPITKTRKWRASFYLDGQIGYGVDSCYGFVPSVWSHELEVC